MKIDKTKMLFLENNVNDGYLIKKEHFLKLTDVEKAQYINFVSKYWNCDAMISIKNNEFYYVDTNSKIENIVKFAESWDESGYKFFQE